MLALTTLTLAGTVAAIVVGVVIGLVTGWVRSVLQWLGARLPARLRCLRGVRAPEDHTTINSGWISVVDSAYPQVHVHLRCAPSSRWPQPARMNRDGAYRFVHRVCPGVFSHEADYAVPDKQIRFSSPDKDGSPPDPAFGCCISTGVIELAVPIAHRLTAEGPVIAVAELSQLIARFHAEVASGSMGGSSRQRRRPWTGCSTSAPGSRPGTPPGWALSFPDVDQVDERGECDRRPMRKAMDEAPSSR